MWGFALLICVVRVYVTVAEWNEDTGRGVAEKLVGEGFK